MARSKKRYDGVTRRIKRLRRGKFSVAFASAASVLTGVSLLGFGLAATPGSAAAAPTANVVSVTVNASAPGGVDNPSVTANVPDNFYDLDVKSSTGEVQWYVTLAGGVPDSNGFNEVDHTGTISCGQSVTYQLLIVQTEGNPLAASGTVQLNGCTSPITTVHVKSSSLDQACSEGQVAQSGQLNITQIGSDRPDSIAVTLANPTDTVQVPLDKLAGKTAQYVVSLKDGQTISDATAVMPASWSGEFVLSHYGCTAASPSPSSTSTQTSCDSSKKDSDGSSKAWYSDLKWNGKNDAQAALDAVQPGGKIVLTDDVNVPTNCTSESFAALYLVPKTGNQVFLDSDTTVNGNKKSLTVTLPAVPNDLIQCGTKYTIQYDSGVGKVLPIIGTDKGKTYHYGDRKFSNGYGTRTFTAPPCPTPTPTPTPTVTPTPTPTHTPTPTPTVTPTVTPSPTVTPTPTHSTTPTAAPTKQSTPPTFVPGPGGTGDKAFTSTSGGPKKGLVGLGLALIIGGVALARKQRRGAHQG